MAEDASRETAARERAPSPTPQRAPSGGLEALPEGVTPAVAGALLGDPRLDGRANAPVRAAAMLQAQRTYGNRAVQRLLATRAVQRDPAATPAPATPASTAEVEQKMNAALQKSALGQAALAIKAKYNIPLVWTTSGAAGYDEGKNQCFVNRNLDPVEAAGYFTHEMHHAEERLTGNSPDADKYKDDQKDAYVTKMVNEEIAGTVLQFESTVEMGGGGGTNAELLTQYKRVWQTAIDNYLKDHPGDQPGAQAAGKQAAGKLVNYWVTGSINPYDYSKSPTKNSRTLNKLGPSSTDTYEAYYVRLFKKAHPQKTTPAPGGATP